MGQGVSAPQDGKLVSDDAAITDGPVVKPALPEMMPVPVYDVSPTAGKDPTTFIDPATVYLIAHYSRSSCHVFVRSGAGGERIRVHLSAREMHHRWQLWMSER